MDPKTSDPSLERRLTGHRGEVTGIAFHPDSMHLASSSSDSTLILWDLKKHARAIKFENHTDQVTDVSFLRNGKMFASSSKDRTIRLWKPSIKTRSKVITAHTSAVRSVHASADSTVLLSASNDKNIKMWTSEHNNKFVSTFKGHTHWVNCARFSSDEKHIISCSEDKSSKLWDRHTNCLIHSFEEKVVPKYVEFHPNNKCVGVALANGHIKIYDIRNHKLLQFYSVHKQCVNRISFHPSGNFFISGSADGMVKVYDIVEGRVIYTLEGHDGAVTAVTFSLDGDRFATAGADKTVLVWNTNFYNKELLAKPLDKGSVNSRPNEVSLEGKTRTVDARLSFSKMEQPELDVSSVQDSPTEENSNGFDSSETSDETFHTTNRDKSLNPSVLEKQKCLRSHENTDDTFHSVNAADIPSNAGGDTSANNDSNILDNVQTRVDTLKSEVKHLQNQLADILKTLTEIESSKKLDRGHCKENPENS